jgi:hypothetical protein
MRFFPSFFTPVRVTMPTSALQLASNRDAGTLTYGLNRAVKGSHLDLAGNLLEVGAK